MLVLHEMRFFGYACNLLAFMKDILCMGFNILYMGVNTWSRKQTVLERVSLTFSNRPQAQYATHTSSRLLTYLCIPLVFLLLLPHRC